MKHRLFLSIEIPSELYPHIQKIQSQINRLKVPVIWRDLEKLHLTLNFMGRVDDAGLPNLRGNLRAEISKFQKFSLIPTFLESLYDKHGGSIIYLAPAGDVDILKHLQKSIGDRLDTLLLPRQSRFLPHIELGKYQKADPTTTKQFMDRVSTLEIDPLPAFEVSRITLFESNLSKTGSHYQKFDTYFLG